MRSLERLIFFRIFRTTTYFTIAFSFCAWIVQSSKYLGLLSNKLSLSKFFYLTSFLAVDIIAFLLPIAFAISVGMVYKRLSESNQLVVLQATGIAPQKLLSPLVVSAILIIGYLYISNAYLSPLSWKEFRRVEFNIKNNIDPPENAGQIFSSNNFSVYAQKYYGDLLFGDIFIIDTRKENETCTLYAERGSIEDNNLFLINGERLETNFENQKNSSTTFKSYSYNLKEIIKITEANVRPNEKFLFQLLEEDAKDKNKTNEQKALFHQKVLSPMLAIIFALVAFFLNVFVPYVRKVSFSRIAWLIVYIIGVQGCFLAFANISAKNPIFIYFNYIFIFLLIVSSIFLVRREE